MTLILLHGYGVRGRFWRYLAPALRSRLFRVLTPDLDMRSVETLLAHCRRLVQREYAAGHEVLLLGHSLGGVAAALTAHDSGPTAVPRVVAIAPPFGRRTRVPGPLTRFIIRRHLIPAFIVRPRFFSHHTPKKRAAALFAESVEETEELRERLSEPVWFHTELLTTPLGKRLLIVASEADRVVPAAESRAMAVHLEAPLHLYSARRAVAHNDFVAAPSLVEEICEIAGLFLAEGTVPAVAAT